MKKNHLKATFLYLLIIIMVGGMTSLLKTETAVASPAQTTTFNGNDDLLAYWTADGGSGTTLSDNSGNGYDLTLNSNKQSYTSDVSTVSFGNEKIVLRHQNGGTLHF